MINAGSSSGAGRGLERVTCTWALPLLPKKPKPNPKKGNGLVALRKLNPSLLTGMTKLVLVDYSTVDNTNFFGTNSFFQNIFSPFFFNRPAVPNWDYQPTHGTLVFDDF